MLANMVFQGASQRKHSLIMVVFRATTVETQFAHKTHTNNTVRRKQIMVRRRENMVRAKNIQKGTKAQFKHSLSTV